MNTEHRVIGGQVKILIRELDTFSASHARTTHGSPVHDRGGDLENPAGLFRRAGGRRHRTRRAVGGLRRGGGDDPRGGHRPIAPHRRAGRTHRGFAAVARTPARRKGPLLKPPATPETMPRIPEDEIERVKGAADLVALIQSRGVSLKQQGGNWTGLCPFHDDRKTPNLIVTPAKGLFRCMACGCGKTGNAIQFVQWHRRRELPPRLRTARQRRQAPRSSRSTAARKPPPSPSCRVRSRPTPKTPPCSTRWPGSTTSGLPPRKTRPRPTTSPPAAWTTRP